MCDSKIAIVCDSKIAIVCDSKIAIVCSSKIAIVCDSKTYSLHYLESLLHNLLGVPPIGCLLG